MPTSRGRDSTDIEALRQISRKGFNTRSFETAKQVGGLVSGCSSNSWMIVVIGGKKRIHELHELHETSWMELVSRGGASAQALLFGFAGNLGVHHEGEDLDDVVAQLTAVDDSVHHSVFKQKL